MKWDDSLVSIDRVRHAEQWKLKAVRGGPYRCDKGHVDNLHHGGWCIACKDNDREANLVWVEADDPKGKSVRLQPYIDLPPLEPPSARWQCCECDSQALPDDYLCGQCRQVMLYY